MRDIFSRLHLSHLFLAAHNSWFRSNYNETRRGYWHNAQTIFNNLVPYNLCWVLFYFINLDSLIIID